MRSGPHRGYQLLAWFFVVTVVCGLALLTGNGFGLGGHPRPSVTAASPSGSPATSVSTATGSRAGSTTAASVASDVDGQVLAAPPDAGNGVSTTGMCQKYKEKRDFLPLNRWTSFSLFTVDNAWIMKTRLFVSMIASLLFMGAGLIWQLIGTLMGFGYTFDMVCWAAPGINTGVHDLSMWASWFLIPVWLFVLTAVIKRWNGGKNGPASAMRLLMVFLTATGMIFFISDQSAEHMDDPTAKYTVPWMAKTVQGWFGEMSSSLTKLTELGSNGATAFYDSDPATAGPVSCVALDNTLYDQYGKDNLDTEMGDGVGGMQQVSKIEEITLDSAWMKAQFGDGDKDYPSPAKAACRDLEARSNVSVQEKLTAYDLSTGNQPGTTTENMNRGYSIAPQDNEQVIMVAWGACKAAPNGRHSNGDNGTIPQWDQASGITGKSEACSVLYSEDAVKGLGSWNGAPAGAANSRNIITLNQFYFNGKDELNKAFGDCIASPKDEVAKACRADWDFVSGWLGANQAERITQGLLSIIIAFVFLRVLGPMAIGLTMASVSLAALCMILPLLLLMFAAGAEGGKKGLKVAGAAAGAKAVFTLGMTFLTGFIALSYSVVQSSVATPTPNFFQQVLEAGTPLAALILFKKGAKLLGLGDISKMTGALGFAGAAMLRATGDKRLHRGAADRISHGLGRIGVGNKRLSALDEKSLQRRMLNNKATRAAAEAVGKGAKHVTRKPRAWARDQYKAGEAWARDQYKAGRSGVKRGRDNLLQWAKSQSPARRAAAYATLAGAGFASTAAGGMGALALPVMLGAGTAALGKTAQLVRGRLEPLGPLKNAMRMFQWLENPSEYAKGSAAGIVTTKNAGLAKVQADDHHRNIIRVRNSARHRMLVTDYVNDGLDKSVARLWGAGHWDGLNTTFKGLPTEEARNAAAREQAAKMGLAPDRVMAGSHGLVAPILVHFDKHAGQRRIDPDTTVEQAGLAFNWLPEHMLRRGVNKTNDQWIADGYAMLRECGYITDNGKQVDAFAAAGLDTSDPKVRERVAAWIAGRQDDELVDKVTIKARRPLDVAMWASRDWVDDHVIMLDQRTDIEAQEAMRSARNEIIDLGKNTVELPSGAAATAEEALIELNQKIDAMKSNDLPRAQGIEELAKVIRDVVDSSSSARNAWQVWAHMYDSATDLDDVDAVKEQIDRLNATMRARKEEWHDELEKLLGGIYRMPRSDDSAARLDEVLEELKNKINNRWADEEWDNRDVMHKVDDIERLLDMQIARMAADQRTSSNRVPKLRDMLDQMFHRSS
ncbi:hypothetical protein [Actinoallomurus sp. NPDC050550]|uniref:hypothetical protein n=1 Tax=Actinoallomurus sp. NPDC050550 TaxID=3154937 RepID=UPI0033D2756C